MKTFSRVSSVLALLVVFLAPSSVAYAVAPAATLTGPDITSPIAPGTPIILLGQCTNTTSAYLSNYGSLTLTSGGGFSAGVVPQVTTTYTLTCTGPDGAATASFTVPVASSTSQPTAAMTVPSAPIDASNSAVSISWQCTNSTAAFITNVGAVSLSGQQTVAITPPQTFTLTCTGSGGTATASGTVYPWPTSSSGVTNPSIAFDVSPSTISPGQGISVTWACSNATSALVNGPGLGSGWTSLNGSTTVQPTVSIGDVLFYHAGCYVTNPQTGGTLSALDNRYVYVVAPTVTPPPSTPGSVTSSITVTVSKQKPGINLYFTSP